MTLTTTTTVMTNHIRRDSGNSKTVCVTAVLTALGVPESKFHTTYNGTRNIWADILRRNGFAARSRKSQLPKRCTVGGARKVIAGKIAQNDPAGTMYVVAVPGHVLLLDGEGRTVVDTDPRNRDRRAVTRIMAVYRSN